MLEELAAFTSTHLAMVGLLMPWKKIVTKDGNTTILLTIWDMLNTEKWPIKVNMVETYDESLETMTNTFLALSVVLLAMTIVGFALLIAFPSLDPNIVSIVDFLTWGLILGLLVCMLISQKDFDASWDHQYNANADMYDVDKMFLPIGVVVVHLALSSFFVGKDIWERLRS